MQRGIDRLRLNLGDASSFLEEVKAAASEAAAFLLPLPTDYLGVDRKLRVAFSTAFPSLPLDFNVHPSPQLDWPHVMGSWLCLYGGGERRVTGDPERTVDASWAQALALLRFALPGADASERQREFEKEIRTYWELQQPVAGHRMTLPQIPQRSCRLYVVSDHSNFQRQNARYIAAESYDDISRLEQRYGRRLMAKRATEQAGFFLQLQSTPPPRLPPKDLTAWLSPHTTDEDRALFESWARESAKLASRWLVLALPVEGIALHTFHLRSENVVPKRAQVFGRRTGRRAGAYAIPERYRAEFTPIDVFDAAVVHHRAGPAAEGLATKRAVLIGAGSLGGEVAVLLARSGVGRLALVDNDKFEDVNIGRHVLGTQSLGRRKVNALKDRITRDVPTVTVEAFPQMFQTMGARLEAEFAAADIVVITTADWGSEDFAWQLKSKGMTWPLVQAWSEPHGLVGHVLAAPDGAFDARYLFDAGDFRYRLSEWPNRGVEPLPACGASYIPGGPIGLSRIAGAVAQVTVDALQRSFSEPRWHVLIGDVEQIAEQGGKYLGDPLPEGMRKAERVCPWPDA